jgi:hypothetical protein
MCVEGWLKNSAAPRIKIYTGCSSLHIEKSPAQDFPVENRQERGLSFLLLGFRAELFVSAFAALGRTHCVPGVAFHADLYVE